MIGRRAFWSNNNDVGNGFEQQSDPMPQPSQKINFKSALEDILVPNSFERGIAMFKVGSYGRLEPVTLTLSKDRFIISILPRKIERVGGNGSSLLRPSILSRVRSGASQTSMGSIGGDSIDGSVASDSIGVLSLLSDTDVDIGSIDRLQSGQMTLKFELARRKEKKQSISQRNAMGIPMLDESKCFSLIFRGAETLDLMVDDGGDREEVLYILNSIIGQYESSKLKVGNEVLLLRYIWNDVDRDDSNTINEKETGELLNRINFHVKEKSTGAMYQKFVKTLGLTKAQRKQGLTFDQCVTLLHKTKRDTWQVKPVTQLFYDMFGQFMTKNKIRKKVSATSFLNRFLLTVQGEENMTMDNVMQIFAKLHQLELADVSNHITEQTYISLEQFEAYLLSRDNDIFNPRREQVCKSSEMSKPLSEYWINSSHNTYLTGDQLTSRSSVEMYTKALYRGCRCLELDVWDGAKDEFGNPMPVVYHGRTLTSKIMFEDIIKSLDVFLMLNPKSYPIILSLENHCSIPFQQAMATQLKSILGSRLYVPDESSLRGSLPSPAQLRGKIVLKGRRPSTGLTDDYDTDDDAADDDLTEMQSVRTEKTSVMGNTKKAQKSVKIAPELAKLTLFHGTKFKSWGESEQALTHHMHSFSESRVRYFCKHNQLQRWIKYNQTHISRTFPSGRRTDSSNYNPILAWSTGCQMVALNLQTPDDMVRLNHGRFRENGEQGYILKPSTLMMKGISEPRTTHLEVKILSGSCLPKPGGLSYGECINPYVTISLFDCGDGKEFTSTQATNTVFNNGFSPIWEFEKSFHFDVKNACVAVMQFTVMDKNSSPTKNDEFIASASVPIACMRQGIRSVQLSDAHNTRSGAFDFASLLVLVKFQHCQAEI